MKKKLLIVKIDHTGDYIIFRNFIKVIRLSSKYKDYEITFLGNLFLRDLIEELDGDIIDNFIWMDLKKFLDDSWYKERKYEEFCQENYEVVFQPTFSRLIQIDLLIDKIEARKKVTFEGHENDIFFEDREKSKFFYSKIIKISNKKLFEYERYKLSIEQFIDEKVNIKKPFISLSEKWYKNLPVKNFIVIYIGADAQYRKWDILNYIKVIKYLLEKYSFNILVCGGDRELKDAEIINKYIVNERLYNIVGQTTLIDLVALINKCKLLISNETNAPHIASALNKNTLVLSNGNHLGRFCPYPKEYNLNYELVCPFSITQEKIDLYYFGSRLDINDIDINEVYKKIDFFLENSIEHKKSQKEVSLSLALSYDNTKSANFNFSLNYSNIYNDVLNLKTKYSKIVIYGNGSIGKTFRLLLSDKFLLVVDKNHQEEDVYPPKKLADIDYDIILISVLGREKEIKSYLINELLIDINKIVTLKVKN